MSDMRKYVRLIESAGNNTVRLIPDLYDDEDELFDEYEMIFNFVDDDDLERDFAVKTMSADDAKRLLVGGGDITVWEAYNDYAEEDQEEIVQDKIDDWNADRIVVVAGSKLVDGNHHVIAGIIANRPIKYINLER